MKAKINQIALAADLKAFRQGQSKAVGASGIPVIIGTVLKDFLVGLEGDPALLAEILNLFNGGAAATPTPTATP